MIPRSGDAQYLEIIDEIFIPVINQFEPDFILVSAGFDPHFSEPLTQLSLSIQGFAQIIKKVKEEALKLCNGKIVILLEGGYNLDAISRGILTEISVLGDLNIELFDDNIPPSEEIVEEYNKKMITNIKEVFSPYWNF